MSYIYYKSVECFLNSTDRGGGSIEKSLFLTQRTTENHRVAQRQFRCSIFIYQCKRR